MTYSVYYYSSPTLGSIIECEGSTFTFEEACKRFKHHTTNVCASLGLTNRVTLVDSNGMICADWLYGQGIVWPKEDV